MKKIILLFSTAIALLCVSCINDDEIAANKKEIDGTTVDFTTLVSGKTVEFRNYSESKVTAFQWYFGDGKGSDLKNPTHTYDKNGKYTATLVGYWSFNGGTLKKVCEKTVMISTSEPEDPTAAYIVGFRLYSLYHIIDKPYCKFECTAKDLWGNNQVLVKTGYTSSVVDYNNLPFTFDLSTPALIGELPNPFDWYDTFTIRVYVASNRSANGALVLEHTVKSEELAKEDEVYIAEVDNGTIVGMIMAYK